MQVNLAEPVLTAFLGGEAMPAMPTLPLELEVAAMTGTRGADVLLLLGLIALFWGFGRLLKGALGNVQPVAVAAGFTAIFMVFCVNSAFYRVAGVRVDEAGVTLETYIGSDEVMPWSDLAIVMLDDGSLFPVFSDDTSLVLIGHSNTRVALPRFVPGIAQVLPVVAQHLHPRASSTESP